MTTFQRLLEWGRTPIVYPRFAYAAFAALALFAAWQIGNARIAITDLRAQTVTQAIDIAELKRAHQASRLEGTRLSTREATRVYYPLGQHRDDPGPLGPNGRPMQ